MSKPKTPGQVLYESGHPGCQWELLHPSNKRWYDRNAAAVIRHHERKARAEAAEVMQPKRARKGAK